MVLEEIWDIAKNDLLIYNIFNDFIIKILTYFRTKRFHLHMRNYLLEGVI
jgi:phosphate starvation-inducible membrane PsiE